MLSTELLSCTTGVQHRQAVRPVPRDDERRREQQQLADEVHAAIERTRLAMERLQEAIGNAHDADE